MAAALALNSSDEVEIDVLILGIESPATLYFVIPARSRNSSLELAPAREALDDRRTMGGTTI